MSAADVQSLPHPLGIVHSCRDLFLGPTSSTCRLTSMHGLVTRMEGSHRVQHCCRGMADDRYVELTGNESQFYKFYRMHNHHFVVWCAMFDGQYETALKYARKAVDTLPAGDANHLGASVREREECLTIAGNNFHHPDGRTSSIFLESYVTMPCGTFLFLFYDDCDSL